ncbi:Phosphatidic Acid Phospholipase A1 [Carabus blaptoides fortunei]
MLFFSDASEKDTSTDFLQNQHIDPGLFISAPPTDLQIVTSTYQQQQVNNPQPPTSVYNAHLFDNLPLTNPSLDLSFNYSSYNNPQQPAPFYDNRFQQPDVTIPSFPNNQTGYDYITPSWISPPDAPVNPVPLFPTIQQDTNFVNPNLTATPPVLATPPLQGPAISYRRQTQKRLTYAPIPGLSATPLQPAPLPTQVPLAVPTYDQRDASPLVVSDCNPGVQSTTQFKPIQSFPPIPQPKQPEFTAPPSFLIPAAELNEIQSLDSSPSEFLSSVMNNASASEVPSSTNPATLNSSTISHIVRSPMGASEMPQPEPSPKPNNNAPYRPVYHHWFYNREIEEKIIWQPFSMMDSLALEAAFVSTDVSPEHMVATDGGRYDVNILRRQRTAVFWTSNPSEVRRCSWFHKFSANGRYIPYEENIASVLEEEYKATYEANIWHRKVELPNGETVIFHSADTFILFPAQAVVPEVWNNSVNQTTIRPRIIKRGMDEFDIDEGEPSKVDHLLFLVHGIGSACDLKFRSVEEVVDDFRTISLQLIQSHYKTSCEQGIANRIEVLPVSWHNQLHSEETGIDKKLKSITLESIPRLRDFTNDTLLDILFYTSPIYSQTIISTVGNELNRIYELFKERNPGFNGSVSLGGHSLGSLILFDILCHQKPIEKGENGNEDSDEDVLPPMKHINKIPPAQRRLSRRISYMMGAVGTGQPQLTYPHLNFHPISFFALGSPIGMFVTVRGLESLGEHFALPTCPGFFNIFHPYDPVAYRIESLINSELSNARPVLIPHHKGRKRMHLELKETMARVGADLKQRLMDSMKSTWNSVYQLAMFHRPDSTSLEAQVDQVIEERINEEECERMSADLIGEEDTETDLPVGILNNGRRIDYVLQEAPFEFINEYIFALTSHVCYWESEDTMLLILKEIYSSMGILTDNKIPQQTMSVERSTPSSTPGSSRAMDITAPLPSMPLIGAPGTSASVDSFMRRT